MAGSLSLVPDPRDRDKPRGICKRPACSTPLPQRAGPGRPAQFCSAECRRLFGVERKRATAAARESRRFAEAYDPSAVQPNVPQARRPHSIIRVPSAGIDAVAAANTTQPDLIRTLMSDLDTLEARISGLSVEPTGDDVVAALRAWRHGVLRALDDQQAEAQ